MDSETNSMTAVYDFEGRDEFKLPWKKRLSGKQSLSGWVPGLVQGWICILVLGLVCIDTKTEQCLFQGVCGGRLGKYKLSYLL